MNRTSHFFFALLLITSFSFNTTTATTQSTTNAEATLEQEYTDVAQELDTLYKEAEMVITKHNPETTIEPVGFALHSIFASDEDIDQLQKKAAETSEVFAKKYHDEAAYLQQIQKLQKRAEALKTKKEELGLALGYYMPRIRQFLHKNKAYVSCAAFIATVASSYYFFMMPSQQKTKKSSTKKTA